MKIKKSGQVFEDLVGASFDYYREHEIACLGFMPVPTKVIGFREGRPNIVLAGRPPFDVYGFSCKDGVFIGAELKSSRLKTSLPIVSPGHSGDGLQFHQLDALATLAKHGGQAYIVWENEGEIGTATNTEIVAAWETVCHALTSEASGKSVKRGAKSIPWSVFSRHVPMQGWNGQVFPNWL